MTLPHFLIRCAEWLLPLAFSLSVFWCADTCSDAHRTIHTEAHCPAPCSAASAHATGDKSEPMREPHAHTESASCSCVCHLPTVAENAPAFCFHRLPALRRFPQHIAVLLSALHEPPYRPPLV